MLLLATLVFGAGAALRWERPVPLAPGLRAPAWSRLVRAERQPGTCRWWLRFPGPPAAALAAQLRVARPDGWQIVTPVQDGAMRVLLRRGDRQLTVVVRDEHGRASRLRVQVRPCAAPAESTAEEVG